MLRFKLFRGDPEELEEAINGWLGKFEPDIREMTQTPEGGGKLTISFIFEEGFRGQELRLTAEARHAPPEPAIPRDELIDEPLIVDPSS